MTDLCSGCCQELGHVPIIAEDLGVITADVNELRKAIGGARHGGAAVRLGQRRDQHASATQPLRKLRVLPRWATCLAFSTHPITNIYWHM